MLSKDVTDKIYRLTRISFRLNRQGAALPEVSVEQ